LLPLAEDIDCAMVTMAFAASQMRRDAMVERRNDQRSKATVCRAPLE
jgi:hypothetical protein